jgi:hypothetical protein
MEPLSFGWRMRDQAAACERRSHSSKPMRPRRASPNGTSERSCSMLVATLPFGIHDRRRFITVASARRSDLRLMVGDNRREHRAPRRHKQALFGQNFKPRFRLSAFSASAAASRFAPKRIYEAWRALNDILFVKIVLSAQSQSR